MLRMPVFAPYICQQKRCHPQRGVVKCGVIKELFVKLWARLKNKIKQTNRKTPNKTKHKTPAKPARDDIPQDWQKLEIRSILDRKGNGYCSP